jgi:hypothetical protein
MAKIIPFKFRKFRRTRLPRRLLNAGWWLERPRPSIIALPKRNAPSPTARPKARHLTLIISGK